jgi:cytoskeleton protein RodZ
MTQEAETDKPKGRPTYRSAGAMLAAERERQGLSRADIAQRLHISVTQIEALEGSDYSRFPRGPFLRGFTRNYARTLGLDAAALVDLVAENTPQEAAPGIVVPSQNIRFDPLGHRLANPYIKAAGIAAAVIVLGFAAMYWWLFIRPAGSGATAPRKPSVESPKIDNIPVQPPATGATQPGAPAKTESSLPAEPAAAPATPTQSTSVPQRANVAQPTNLPASSPVTQAAPAAIFAPAPATAVARAGESTIRLAFRSAAWVEVVDASGQSLVSRNHPAGTSSEVYGKPPFRVVVGNASDVRLTYNGREVDLAPHTRVNVARLTLQ